MSTKCWLLDDDFVTEVEDAISERDAAAEAAMQYWTSRDPFVLPKTVTVLVHWDGVTYLNTVKARLELTPEPGVPMAMKEGQ